jgi:hypothetical protein
MNFPKITQRRLLKASGTLRTTLDIETMSTKRIQRIISVLKEMEDELADYE